MTPDFTPDRRYQVEQHLRRDLTVDELVTVPSVSDLTPAHKAVLDFLALKHRLVAMIYLCGVVDGLIAPEARAIIDTIRDRAGL